jgi:hypothetical protein
MERTEKCKNMMIILGLFAYLFHNVVAGLEKRFQIQKYITKVRSLAYLTLCYKMNNKTETLDSYLQKGQE